MAAPQKLLLPMPRVHSKFGKPQPSIACVKIVRPVPHVITCEVKFQDRRVPALPRLHTVVKASEIQRCHVQRW